MYLILGFNGAVLDYAITFCGVLCLVDNVAFKGVHCKSRTEAAGVLNRNVSDNVLVIPRLDNAPEQYLGLARSLAEAAPVKQRDYSEGGLARSLAEAAPVKQRDYSEGVLGRLRGDTDGVKANPLFSNFPLVVESKIAESKA